MNFINCFDTNCLTSSVTLGNPDQHNRRILSSSGGGISNLSMERPNVTDANAPLIEPPSFG